MRKILCLKFQFDDTFKVFILLSAVKVIERKEETYANRWRLILITMEIYMQKRDEIYIFLKEAMKIVIFLNLKGD